MDVKKIYLTENIHEDAVAFLKQHLEVVQGTSVSSEDIIAGAKDCDAILIRSAKITKEIMEQLPKLAVVAKHGIGVDNIDVAYATKQGILVVNAPFSNLNAVAEHSLALILAASKHLVLLDGTLRGGNFAVRNQYVNLELKGKTLGLVGFGRIARMLAQKAAGLEMKIVAADPYADKTVAGEMGVELVTQEKLLEISDFISLHVPLMEGTRHMVDEEFLKKMKPQAWLINASRGPVVDEQALIKALQENRIGGAALDVFEPEPPKADNPLFEMDQVIVSPHNAALTDAALLAMAMDSAQGVVDYLEGRNPQFPVNPEVLQQENNRR